MMNTQAIRDRIRRDNQRESEISYERLVELDNLRWKVRVLEGMLTALGHGDTVALMQPVSTSTEEP